MGFIRFHLALNLAQSVNSICEVRRKNVKSIGIRRSLMPNNWASAGFTLHFLSVRMCKKSIIRISISGVFSSVLDHIWTIQTKREHWLYFKRFYLLLAFKGTRLFQLLQKSAKTRENQNIDHKTSGQDGIQARMIEVTEHKWLSSAPPVCPVTRKVHFFHLVRVVYIKTKKRASIVISWRFASLNIKLQLNTSTNFLSVVECHFCTFSVRRWRSDIGR